MLDAFALVILLVMSASAVATAVIVAALPGRIARERKHPQAAAISVCGWWGLLTFGALLPIAYIWAYTDASQPLFGLSQSSDADLADGRAAATEAPA